MRIWYDMTERNQFYATSVFKDRATGMVFDRLDDDDATSRYSVIRQTPPQLSIAVEMLRRPVEPAEVDAGKNQVCQLTPRRSFAS